MSYRKIALGLVAAVFLSACGAPGQPPLVTRAAPGAPLIGDCQNVVGTVPRPEFLTDFYLTTAGSALSEGAAAGLREGLTEGGALGVIALSRLPEPDRINGAPVVWRDSSTEPFCMAINAPPAVVERALSQSFGSLSRYGYRSGRRDGIHATDFVSRAHRAARWMDRFSGFAVDLPDGRTAVYVKRDVVISRQGAPYVQADSVGMLETHLLAMTRDLANAAAGRSRSAAGR